MLARNLHNKIESLLQQFPVVVIVGSRQCGKTTLARMVAPEWHYFDLERGSDRDLISRDFDFFFREYPHQVIIDEAQSLPQLFTELRGVVDSDRTRRGRFLLTGSSSPELLKEVSETLAGRVAVVELGTLTMNERHTLPLSHLYDVLNNPTLSEHLTELRNLPVRLEYKQVLDHFLKGGYPEPTVVGSDQFQWQWSEQFHQSYIMRDIRALFPGLNVESYRRFILMLSQLSGTIINRSEIGRSLGVNESTVRNYLDIAQGTFIWRNIGSYESKVIKSVVKMPRGYLRDSGLLHFLTDTYNREQLFSRSGSGAAFEGFVIEEVIQGLECRITLPWHYSYYRTRGGAEVDLVLRSPTGTIIPIEVKFGTTVKGGDLHTIRNFIEQEQAPYGIVLNNAEQVKMLADKVIQIPAGCL
ncbi:MAG: ATP-binding protein [Lentisphaerae bacterium]|nr:ATP-binding protein [Lentisphaerota bacterium]